MPETIRLEIAKTGFKATQGVRTASFDMVESTDGDRWQLTARQTLIPLDAVFTEKHGERFARGFAQESRGVYAGPLTVVRFERNRPPLVGELLPSLFWSSTRITEFALEERVDFPHAEGGRLVARIAYEGHHDDGSLAASARGRLRCAVTKLASAASIDARLAGSAARIECVESLQVVEREIYDKAPQRPYDDRVSYAHWYIFERGWSIASEGEYPVRAAGLSAVRTWTSKLISFD